MEAAGLGSKTVLHSVKSSCQSWILRSFLSKFCPCVLPLHFSSVVLAFISDFWATWKGCDSFPCAHSGGLPPSIKVGCTQINAKRCISPKSPSPKVFPFLFQFSSITYSQYFFKYTWMKKHKWISGSICVSMQYQSSMCLEKFCQSTNGTLYHLECNFITTITYRVGLTLSLRTFVENRISGTGAMGRLLRLGLVAIFHFYGRWKIILTAAWLLCRPCTTWLCITRQCSRLVHRWFVWLNIDF